MWLAGLEAERARVEPFDFEGIRARAARLDEAPVRAPAASGGWRRWLQMMIPVVAIATALVVIAHPEGPLREGSNRVKGESDLGFYLLRGAAIYPGDPEAVFRPGDQLQFTYRAPHDRLVLLSIDGTGRLTQYYPEAGEEGLAIIPGDRHLIDTSILLDDAPGPETFVGFFGGGWGVSRARTVAERAYAEGGVGALVGLAEEDPSIVTLVLEKE